MSSEADKQANQDEEILRDVLKGRKFSVADLIAKEGGGFLKGDSPVPKLVQVETEINTFIATYLSDSSGALQIVLQKWVKAEQSILNKHLDSPLSALVKIIEKITQNQELLYELVKEVDCQWGQLTGERPYFQTPGETAHPDDEYTHESVNRQLDQLLESIKTQGEESS
jgi:hypothetical protein